MANSVPLALQRSLPQNDEELFLDDQTQWNARLWRRLARATEAVAGIPVAWPLPWECRAAQSRLARPKGAQGASWGTAKAGTLVMSTTIWLVMNSHTWIGFQPPLHRVTASVT